MTENDPKRFIRHTSCEQCGSSDANALYADGSLYCFSCRNYTEPPKDKTRLEELLGDDTKIQGSAPKVIPLGVSKPIPEK
jgi:prepilin-type processing-associated H-X9-DG protein